MKKFTIAVALLAGMSFSACSGEDETPPAKPSPSATKASEKVETPEPEPEAEAPQVVKYECSNVTGTLTLRADGMWWGQDNGEDTIALPLGTTVDEAIAALPGCVVA